MSVFECKRDRERKGKTEREKEVKKTGTVIENPLKIVQKHCCGKKRKTFVSSKCGMGGSGSEERQEQRQIQQQRERNRRVRADTPE